MIVRYGRWAGLWLLLALAGCTTSYYRKSADQAFADAQFNLGVLYYNGQGVRQDDVSAHLWFQLAAQCYPASASARHDNAVKSRDIVAARMTPSQLARSRLLARQWLATHADLAPQ